MNDTTKKIIFLATGGGLVLILLIVLVVTLLSNGKGPDNSSHIPTGGNDVSLESGYTTDVQDESDLPTTAAQSGSAESQSSGSPSTSIKNQTGTQTDGGNTTKSVSTTTSAPTNNSKSYSLLTDPGFLNGFKALGMSTADGGQGGSTIFNPLSSSGRQYWNLAQWGSRYSFADTNYTTFKDLGNGVFKYINTTKEFTIDTNTAKLTFTGLASKCYDKPRTGSEPWLHILIEQNFKTADTKVTDLESVVVTMSNRLIMFEDHMGSAFNPNTHAAQYLMYFSVRNKDTNDFIWFGFPLFDNRSEWNEPSSMFDKGTSALMVGIGNRVLYQANGKNNCWKNGKINAGPTVDWSTFNIDVLPLIKGALETAHNDGYMENTSVDQLVISGMNLGWEIPGTYDASMEMKDFSVTATKK